MRITYKRSRTHKILKKYIHLVRIRVTIVQPVAIKKKSYSVVIGKWVANIISILRWLRQKCLLLEYSKPFRLDTDCPQIKKNNNNQISHYIYIQLIWIFVCVSSSFAHKSQIIVPMNIKNYNENNKIFNENKDWFIWKPGALRTRYFNMNKTKFTFGTSIQLNLMSRH